MKTKKEQFAADFAEKNAARMLLEDYIVNNPKKVATALEQLIPFFFECSLLGLKSCMNTVNVTFASVALNVIESTAECGDEMDSERQYLPVDAGEMRQAIYYISKFVEAVGPLSYLCTEDAPAIKMTRQAFTKLEHC